MFLYLKASGSIVERLVPFLLHTPFFLLLSTKEVMIIASIHFLQTLRPRKSDVSELISPATFLSVFTVRTLHRVLTLSIQSPFFLELRPDDF